MQPVESDDRAEFKFTFRGPPSQDPSEPIVDLPGVVGVTPSGRTEFISMWKPTPDELAALNAGHHIAVGILNNGSPIFPFFVGVTKQPTTLLEYADDASCAST